MGHGIDMHRRQPPHTPIPEPGMIRCYSSGRISASKGIETLLAAYTELAQRGKHVTLTLYGAPITNEDEAYEKRLTTALSEKGIDPATIFKGAVPHKELPYRRAEAEYFLHASTTGSLDKAVLDAVVSGLLPVTSSQAYHELLGEYEPLLTYPEGDASALADRILELERLTEEEKETMRTTLRKRVAESHSLESLVRRLYALLAS
jgi:glycosyltransferase involved in cell wall biosynthesis